MRIAESASHQIFERSWRHGETLCGKFVSVGDLRALVADIRKDPRKFLNIKVSVF